MIDDLLSEFALIATLSLIAMPLVASRVRNAFLPDELPRFNTATMGVGFVLLVTALAACSVRVVIAVSAHAGPDHHYFPGETIIGWLSGAAALALLGAFAIGLGRTGEVQRRLIVEAAVGQHHKHPGFDLVILPSARQVAYAVGGRTPQVVVTSGLIDTLTPPELRSVIEHELAHISMRHRAHLALVGMLEPIRALWPVQRLIDTTLLALEHAADSKTTDRRATRSALLRLSGVPVAAGVAGFTAGDVIRRIDALDSAPVVRSSRTRTAVYATALGLTTLSISALVAFFG